jgi:hypothetical protein
VSLVFIGVDDTDILGGPYGTGKMAKGMAEHLEKQGLGRTTGVIRHQLLVDPRIHYTSHNSSKCVEFEASGPLARVHEECIAYLKKNCLAGSDPGVCTCGAGQVTPELVAYAERAQIDVIPKDRAVKLASKLGILLSEVAGTGDGIIGALASAGLRGSGNGGRYVQLRGIGQMKGLVTVGTILDQTATTAVVDEQGNAVGRSETVDSKDWIKPSVVGGRPVLRIKLESDGSRRIWETVEQKHKKSEDD